MRKIYFLAGVFILFLRSHLGLSAQISTFVGVEAKFNNSTQLFYNPQKPLEGLYQAGNIQTFGIGFWGEKQIFPFLSGIARISFLRKGSFDYDILTKDVFENKYDYLDVDFIWCQKTRRRFIPNIYGGLHSGFVLNQKIVGEFHPNSANIEYVINEFTNFNRMSTGWVMGLKYALNNKFQVGMEMRRDLSPVISTFEFQMYNRVISLNISYILMQL